MIVNQRPKYGGSTWFRLSGDLHRPTATTELSIATENGGEMLERTPDSFQPHCSSLR